VKHDNILVFTGKNLTNKEKLVCAHHHFTNHQHYEATKLLSSVDRHYLEQDLHKDVSRALLCHCTYAKTQDPGIGKESEFYLIVYYLVRHISETKIHFKNSGYFYMLKEELFKGFL
jgi:hypothetical protein